MSGYTGSQGAVVRMNAQADAQIARRLFARSSSCWRNCLTKAEFSAGHPRQLRVSSTQA